VGPFRIKVRLPRGVEGRSAQWLVSGTKARALPAQGWVSVEVKSILDHEVLVIA